MLWVALTARNSGCRASELIEIHNPIAALDFDMACSLRLIEFDNGVAETNAKMIAYEVVKAAFGDGSS